MRKYGLLSLVVCILLIVMTFFGCDTAVFNDESPNQNSTTQNTVNSSNLSTGQKKYKTSYTFDEIVSKTTYTEINDVISSDYIGYEVFGGYTGETITKIAFIQQGIVYELTPWTDSNIEFSYGQISSVSMSSTITHSYSVGTEVALIKDILSLNMGYEKSSAYTQTKTWIETSSFSQSLNINDYKPGYQYKVVLVADYYIYQYVKNQITAAFGIPTGTRELERFYYISDMSNYSIYVLRR